MGTWICHLRVAERLLPRLVEEEVRPLDEVAFAFGSLAPDSGRPNERWDAFDPPKSVTRFLTPDSSEEDKIEDTRFYEGYLQESDELTTADYAFALGYFFHLLCDNLWSRKVWRPTATALADWLADDADAVITAVKRDWYGLDHLYVQRTGDSLFSRVILPHLNPSPPFAFLFEDGLNWRLDHIHVCYSHPPDYDLNRPYAYLDQRTMQRFVAEATTHLHRIHRAERQRRAGNAEQVTQSR